MHTRGIFAVEPEIGLIDSRLAARRIADDGRSFERRLLIDRERGVANRRPRGNDRELREAIEQGQLLGVEMSFRLEPVHLGRDARAQALLRRERQRANSGPSRDQGRPELGKCGTDRRYDAYPGDHHALHDCDFMIASS
jgi:hypothetical protein